MYAGRVVERATAAELFAAPRHPYHEGLLRSVPSSEGAGDRKRLVEIPGVVPPMTERPEGCKFADRCPAVQADCRETEPALVTLGTRAVRCHHPLESPHPFRGATS